MSSASNDVDWTCDVCNKKFDSFRGVFGHRQKSCYVTKEKNVNHTKKTISVEAIFKLDYVRLD